MPEIIVIVAKDGSTKVEVQGAAGPGCRDMSAALEAALGAPASCELTADYYQQAQEGADQVSQHG